MRFRNIRFGVVAGALLAAGCATTMQQPLPATKLYTQTFGPARSASARTLLIVINGDGLPNDRADHESFAAAAARSIPGSVAVAVLRPGYADRAGNRSPGERGIDAGDNYTADRIASVGDAVAALRIRYPRARTIVVGDTGGAAIAANLAGMRPGLIDGMVLVACPCTLPEWRRYMDRKLPGNAWKTEVSSLDPLKTAGGVLPGLRAAVLVGADDSITPVKFSRAYAEALSLRGIATDYRIVPGKGHDLLNDPEVLTATARLAAELPKKI